MVVVVMVRLFLLLLQRYGAFGKKAVPIGRLQNSAGTFLVQIWDAAAVRDATGGGRTLAGGAAGGIINIKLIKSG